MALKYVDSSGTLTVPGAYGEWQTAPSASGTATTGVVVLIGEAEAGPNFATDDVVQGGFGPSQKAAVVAKYGSGRLVDAYVQACQPSKDSGVKGAPQRIFLIKTNLGTAASLAMTSSYATLGAKLEGANGNLIQVNVTSAGAGKIKIEVLRRLDSIDETFTVGGNIGLTITAARTCSLTITATGMASAGVGGSVAALSLTWSQFKTLRDLASYISAQQGWTAAVAAAFGQRSPTMLDQGTYSPTCATGTATLSGVVAGDKLTIAGHDFACVASGATGNSFNVGLTDTASATNLAAAINGSVTTGIAGVVRAGNANSAVLTVTAMVSGIAGNSISLAQTGGHITVPVATLGSGTDTLVKMDAADFTNAISGSRLVKVTVAPTAGLPTVMSAPSYLSGGLRGTSSDQNFIDAMAQAKRIRANFVVPLISQDATSVDETDTDAGSTYTVAGVNAALLSHIIECSQFKARRPRQGFASIRDTYINQKTAAQNQASPRISMSFLDILDSGQSGLGWFQPWMEAVVAASFQAAAFYQSIFGKVLNISGARHYQSGQFVTETTDQEEDALDAGLLIVAPRDDGGFEFVSDQTTFGADDSNTVLNSIQGVYVADTILMTTQAIMERTYKGKNFADVTAGAAMSTFKACMSNLRRLKLIKGTPDVPAGYKDAVISISPPTMMVSAEVKEATSLYFMKLDFLITQSTDTATA